MKPIKTIKDPEAFQLLADETRRRIISLLRAKEMTVSQIASELELTPQAVYHHIKRMLTADLVEVSREVRVDHLIESYYRTTAEVFYCSVGQKARSAKIARDSLQSTLAGLKKIGFKIEADENAISRLLELEMKMQECCQSGMFEEKVAELDDTDILTQQNISEYAELISMSDEEFEKQHELKKKFRDALISLIKK